MVEATEGGPGLDDAPGDGGEAGIGARLRALRESRSLQIAEVVERTGLSRNTVRNAESGLHAPDLRTLTALATAYEVPVASLLDEQQEGL